MDEFRPAELIPKEMDFETEAKRLGVSVDGLKKAYEDTLNEEVWLNDTYQVNIRRHPPTEDTPAIIHLSVKRIDKQPVHDWRDMQQIKNELTDPEFEGVELFPAESRLVDTANQYHIWVIAEKGFRVPVGFPGRLVNYESGVNGAVQRPK